VDFSLAVVDDQLVALDAFLDPIQENLAKPSFMLIVK